MIELLSGEMSYLWEMKVVEDSTGLTHDKGWFITEEDAIEAGKQSKPGFTRFVQAYQVLKQALSPGKFNYYKIERITIYSDEEIRKQALAKLTSVEKKVLGL